MQKDQLFLLWSLVISKRCITLETANDLKTLILPSKVDCLMRHILKMFSILTICLQKFLLYDKRTPGMFTLSLLKLTHFMPQSDT